MENIRVCDSVHSENTAFVTVSSLVKITVFFFFYFVLTPGCQQKRKVTLPLGMFRLSLFLIVALVLCHLLV